MRVKAAGPAGYKQDNEPRTAPYILLAGPNGAGKTTASGHVLRNVPGLIHYLNADRIANGLAPEHPEGVAAQAARILLGQFDDLVRQRVTFAVETTLSGRAYAGRIRRLRQEIGYRFELVDLWLPSPELSKQRVASRVLAGGHFIPTDDVFRRYDPSLRNLFRVYLPLADHWRVYDNSGSAPYRLVAEQTDDGGVEVHDVELWQSLETRYA